MPPKTTSQVRFESLAFQVEPAAGSKPLATARAVIRRAFPGERWTISPLGSPTEFEAVPTKRKGRAALTGRGRGKRPMAVSSGLGDAWTMTYALRAQARVVYAEPLVEIEDRAQFATAAPARRARSSGDGDDDPGTENDYEWSPKALKAPHAWNLFHGRAPGADVVVGHPDTGYTPHPEIVDSHLRPGAGYDYQDDDPDSLDPLPGRRFGLRHPGHGTSTSSLIISGQGLQPGPHGPAFVSGIAPGAALIPIRTTKSVMLWSMSRLTRAVGHAVSRGAHVISISLGGPVPSVALHSAMRDAEKAGVIVLCAAGNQVRFVVFPAAFDEVIAVAASRIDNTEWPGSCRGSAVDITAPGSSVWRAKTKKKAGGSLDFTVERGSGTSYAVAQAAGLAALWLSYHGRQNLIARYTKARLASVFKRLLQQTCRTPSGWDTNDFGPGIADAYALLSASLPKDPPARGLRGIRRRAVSDGSSLDVLVHQLAPAPRSGVTKAVANLLNVTEAGLDDALEDVGAELVMRVGVDGQLREWLKAAATSSGGGRSAKTRTSTAAARRRAGDRQASSRLRKYVKGRGRVR